MNVLIIEDDLALADVLAFTLRRAGYETMMAHDGSSSPTSSLMSFSSGFCLSEVVTIVYPALCRLPWILSALA